MNPTRTCPQCGAHLDSGTPEGLCPACMMKAGLPTAATGPSDAPPADPLTLHEIASHFPQFDILELLGRGGMGVVYKARQKQLDRIVALKVLPPEVARDPRFAERFLREARALARLNHPNIVAVHEYGESGGLYFLVMEFVSGLNLRQLEQSRRLAPAEALAIVPKICDALQYAHEQGVVHRDIKPENILVDEHGRVKIADFGLAKLAELTPADPRLTQCNLVMGTPHYMAPEQTERPTEVDHRADIYSLGVVFYEMLTGELPLGRFQPPSARVQLDVRLDEVVLKSLAKEPERRYQHASEVKTAVEGVAGSPPFPAHHLNDDVQRQVRGPAIGLLATGILNWLLVAMLVLFFFPFVFYQAVGTAELLAFAGAAVFLVPLTTLMTIGALKMRRLESYGWAIAASVIALFGGAIGLPFGIWALVVLVQPEVRAAFQREKPGRRRDERRWGPIGLAAGLHATGMLAIAAILLVTAPRMLLIIQDLGTELPRSTQLMAAASQLALRGGYLLLPVLIAIDVLCCWAAQRIGGRRLLAGWTVAGLFGLVVIAAVVMQALFMPLRTMIAQLQPPIPAPPAATEEQKRAAAEVLRQMGRKYEAMSSFAASGRVTSEFTSAAGATSPPTTRMFTVKLSRQEFYCVTWSERAGSGFTMNGAAWCAGKGHQVLNANKVTHYPNRAIALGGAAGVSGGVSMTVPSMFFREDTHDVADGFQDPVFLPEETINGEVCYVVGGVHGAARATVWISQNNLLLRRFQINLQSGTITENYESVAVNEPLKQEEFEFRPPDASLPGT